MITHDIFEADIFEADIFEADIFEADILHSELRILDWILYVVCSNEIHWEDKFSISFCSLRRV